MELRFQHLEAAEADLREAAHLVVRSGSGKLFPVDFLAWAAANRSLGLIAAFRHCIESHNYITAAALVRLQLDTGLRFMATWHVADPHAFALRVLSGERIDKCRDRRGKPLKDAYLVDLAQPEYPWVKTVYEATSGFVHLSERHIFATIEEASEDRVLTGSISGKDPERLTDGQRQEAIDGFTAAVQLLVRYLTGWGATKDAGEHSAPDA